MTVLEARPSLESIRTTASDEREPDIRRALQLLLRSAPAARDVDLDDLFRWIETQPDRYVALGRTARRLAAHQPDAGTRSKVTTPPAGPTPTFSPSPPAPESAPIETATTLTLLGPPQLVQPVTDPPELPAAARRRARIALWVRNGGIVVLLFLAYQLWGTGFEQRKAQAHLGSSFAGLAVTQSTSSAAATGNAAASAGRGGAHPGPTRGAQGLPGGVVARLQIPAIHVDQFVVEGTDDAALRKGPGHYVGAPMPGEHGNVAIAGHRTTYGAPFNRLDKLRPGATIAATTPKGEFVYVVSSEETVPPSQSTVVQDYGDDRMTLTTCTPEFSATSRLVVFAKLEGPVPTPPPALVAAPGPMAVHPLTGSSPVLVNLHRSGREDGWRWGSLPGCILATMLLGAVAAAYRPLRRLVPPVGSFVLLGPLWLATLLLVFEQLSRLLPPNL